MWGVQPALRRGVIVATLVACVGIAAAQKGHRGGGDTDASAMDETTGSVAPPGGKRAGAELALSDEQRSRIFEGVMGVADAPVAQVPAPALADRQSGAPLEGRAVLAYRDHRLDEVVIYASTQTPHMVRVAIADNLGIDERCVRVVAPDVGGGFGPKARLYPEEIILAALCEAPIAAAAE